MDILSIVVANGIPTKFEEETLAAADAVPDTIDPADFPERRDLRDQQIVTIDGADAKDLDDVTVKALPDGSFYLCAYRRCFLLCDRKQCVGQRSF